MSVKVLIIDDNDEIRILLKTLLTRAGFKVETAEDGQAGLDYLASCTELPDVILLDLIMPRMDGYKFREIQVQDERMGRIPVIVMTANQMQDGSKNLNGLEYLRKPIQIEDLITSIRKAGPAG
jgi:two-component system, chemotaxis family, chemotaxis protein CheY